MKKNNIKNKNLLSALTIGISAMMFLQTPITAFAEGNGELDDTTPSEPQTESNESQSESSYEPVTNEAQTEATQAYDACVSEQPVTAPPQETPAPEQTAQTPSTEQNAEQAQPAPTIAGAEVEANEAANIILTGDVKNNIPPAGEKEIATEEVAGAIGELKGAATEVKNDKNIEAAAEDIKEVKTDLAEAEDANKEAEKADKAVIEAAETAADYLEGDLGILKVADNVEDIVDETNTKGQELVQKIVSAETDIDKQAAKAEFDKFVEENTESLNGQIALYSKLSERYAEAVAELSKAQEKLKEQDGIFNDELGSAKGYTAKANAEVEAAQQKVETLASAMKKVQDAIADSNTEGADNLEKTKGKNNDWSDVFGVKVDTSRNAMKDVIVNYYLPEVIGEKVVQDDEHKVEFSVHQFNSGKTGYERNYTQVNYWYLDKNNELKQATRYFNWDSIAKTDANNQNLEKKNIEEAGTAIVMYEKSEDEVTSHVYNAELDAKAKSLLEHLSDAEKEAYKRNGKFILDNANVPRCTEQGMFRLYSYKDKDGNVNYITQFQLLGGYPTGTGRYDDEGDLTKTDKLNKAFDDEGNFIGYKIPGVADIITDLKVEEKKDEEQNLNGLYKNANCLILGDNTTVANVLRGKGGYGFVKENIIDQYGISEATVDRLIAENAKLNNFIDANNSENNKALADKYDAYAKEVVEAQIAVQNANQQVDDLSRAIDDIRDKSARKSKTMKATEALNTTDIAGYFGLTVGEGGLTEDEAAALNNMTLVELISKLNKYKKDADEKVSNAKLAFSEVIDRIVADAQRESEVRPSGGGGDETPDAGGDTTPATPAAPAAGGTIAQATTNPTPSAAPVLAAVEAAMAADAGAGQANPAAQAIADFAAGQADQGDAGNVEIADGDVALAEMPDAAPVVEETDETLVNKVDIEDSAVALASGTTVNDETRKMNWWWILIVALLGVTGKKMYEEHMRKEEEKNKNKID